MNNIGKIAFVAALCITTPRVFAADGILIVEKTTTGTVTQSNEVQIEKDRMRAETSGANGEKRVMVFDGAKQVLTTIDVANKTYTEMTKADADRMGGQMADAMTRMQAQMANMPPAQRAQMEAMMSGRMAGAGAPVKTEYRKAGTDKAGKWTCDKYEGFQNSQKVSELCTVDPKVLGLATVDFDVTKQLGDFFKGILPQGADRVFAIGTPETLGYSGVPVRRVSYSNGQVTSTTELADIRHQSFAAATYEVPAGFQKQAMGMPGGRRGGRAGAGGPAGQ